MIGRAALCLLLAAPDAYAEAKGGDREGEILDTSALVRAVGEPAAQARPPVSGAQARPVQGLGWREAVAIAVGRYPTITSALGSLARQGEMVDVARSGYYPQIKAGVTLGQQDTFGTGPVATLGVSQMLYDFGKTSSAVDRERAGVRQKQALALQAMDAVAKQTVQALIEIHRYQTLQQIAQARIEALNKLKGITELRANAGVANQSDPVQASARVEAAQAHLLEINAQLAQWRSRLITYLGPTNLPVEVQDAPADLFEASDAPIGDEQLARLPAVLAAQAAREIARADLRNLRAQRYPTITLEATGNKRMGAAGDRYAQIYDKSTYAAAYLSLNSSLFNGGAMAAQSRAAAQAVAAADADVEAARLAALDELRGYSEQAAGLRGRFGVLEQRVQSITHTRELYWDQYLSLGTRTVLDLLNAEQEGSQSLEDLANARHDLMIAQLGALVASGRARAAFRLDNTKVQGAEILP